MAKKECPICGTKIKGNECPGCGVIIPEEQEPAAELSQPDARVLEKEENQVQMAEGVSAGTPEPGEKGVVTETPGVEQPPQEPQKEEKKSEFRLEDLPLPEVIAEQKELNEHQRNFIRKMEFDDTAINTAPTAVDRFLSRKPFRERYRKKIISPDMNFLVSLTAYSFLIFLLGYVLGFLYIFYTPNNFFLLNIDSFAIIYTLFLGGVFVVAVVAGRKEIRVKEKHERQFLVITTVGVFLLYFIPLCENFYIIVIRDWMLRLGLYIGFCVAGAALVGYSLKKSPSAENYKMNFLSTLFLFAALVGGGITFKHMLINMGGGAPPPAIMTYSGYLHFGFIDFYLLGVVGVNLLLDYRKILGKRNLVDTWVEFDLKNAYESMAHQNYMLAMRYCLRAEKNALDYARQMLEAKGETLGEPKMIRIAKDVFPNFGELKLLKAYAFYKLERYEDAEFEIYHAVDVDPNNAISWLLYGNILHAKGEDAHAIKCYANGVRVNPSLPELWNNLGNLYLLNRKFREAEKCYIRATTLRPGYKEALANRSYLYLKQEKYDLALKYADLAMGIKPKKERKKKKKGR
ncbi:MAG: tetratricopeptide repeat protein [Thermoplasmata archaeon]|nr:tetratricopeptide repeat protein [Thermoplasmata archaeon]